MLVFLRFYCYFLSKAYIHKVWELGKPQSLYTKGLGAWKAPKLIYVRFVSLEGSKAYIRKVWELGILQNLYKTFIKTPYKTLIRNLVRFVQGLL